MLSRIRAAIGAGPAEVADPSSHPALAPDPAATPGAESATDHGPEPATDHGPRSATDHGPGSATDHAPATATASRPRGPLDSARHLDLSAARLSAYRASVRRTTPPQLTAEI